MLASGNRMLAPPTYGVLSMPDEITWFEILTLIALIAGPLIAVIIARNIDTRRAKRERRMDIFRTLMRTIGPPLWMLQAAPVGRPTLAGSFMA